MPYRLKEELINYLYMNKLTTHVDFDVVNHIDFCISPVPVVKALFDKINFYNICIQKLLVYAANDKATIIELASNLLGSNKIIKAIIEVARKEYDVIKRFKTPTCLINRNDYVIDKFRKFAYLINTDLIPNQISFPDNEFYAIFSSKYPIYFPTSSEVNVLKDSEDKNQDNPEYITYLNKAFFYDSKTSSNTRTTSVDNICSSIINVMKEFTQEYNNFLQIANKESYYYKSRVEEERKKRERLEKLNDEEGEIKLDSEQIVNNKEKEKEEDIKDPNAQVMMFNETMVLFICREKNEENRLEQLFLINELYTKQ
jgi:hypothetical protein